MSTVAKLEALLARVQENRTKPRALRVVSAPAQAAQPAPVAQPAPAQAAQPAPVAQPAPLAQQPAPVAQPAAPRPPAAPVASTRTPTPAIASPAPSSTPTPAPRSPFGAATTPTPAPRSPVELPISALIGAPPASRPPTAPPDAITPPRGLRTPVPPTPAVPSFAEPPAAEPAAPPARAHRPTPLELAVVSEAEFAPTDALEARTIGPASVSPPSAPIVNIASDIDAPQPVTFGVLLRRTLALRPR